MTAVAAESVTEHVPVPVHAPDHPANVEPDAGVAVSVTAVPIGKLAEHVWPQLIPEGLLVTAPDPVPAACTVSATVGGGAVSVLKVAVTVAAAESVTEHVPVPVHAPDHPANVELESGVAVSVTAVPLAKLAEHVCPQLIPEGLLVTVPDPVPASCTVSCTAGGVAVLNVAVTDESDPSVTTHEPVPEHVPVQPAKVEPCAAVAVSVTLVPAAKLAEQLWPQLIPPGVLETVPEPVPVACTVS